MTQSSAWKSLRNVSITLVAAIAFPAMAEKNPALILQQDRPAPDAFVLDGIDTSLTAVEVAARNYCGASGQCLREYEDAWYDFKGRFENSAKSRRGIRKALLAETRDGHTDWKWAAEVYFMEERRPTRYRGWPTTVTGSCVTDESADGRRITTTCTSSSN